MSNPLPKNNKRNSNDIIIDDGSKVYNIKNRRGELIGKFVFNPTDVDGIMERYNHSLDKFEELQKEFSGTVDEKQILHISSEMKKEIDYLFNADASDFFKKAGPFSIVGSDEFFVVHLIDSVRKVMETETGKRLSRVKSKASKYTAKYRK